LRQKLYLVGGATLTTIEPSDVAKQLIYNGAVLTLPL